MTPTRFILQQMGHTSICGVLLAVTLGVARTAGCGPESEHSAQ